MPKGKLLDDTFEQLVELGQSTAKQTVKSVAKAFNPLSVFETSNTSTSSAEQLKEKLSKEKSNHTPLNLEKLHNNYQNQEKAKQAALRQRLFQLVRQGEQQVIYDKKQQETRKQQEEAYIKQEKQRQETIKRQQEQVVIPRGKVRKTIFSPKKTAERQHAETKPSVGKQ